MKYLLLSLLLICSGNILVAQQEMTTETTQYTSDSETPESVMKALLDVISGPKDAPRNWARFRNLFLPSATLGVVGKNQEGKFGHRVFTVEEFIKNSGPNYAKGGFYEVELGHVLENWNGIASAMQSYEWTIPNTENTQRGVNNYQFIYSDGRWYVSNLVFSSESSDQPIPDHYISSKQ